MSGGACLLNVCVQSMLFGGQNVSPPVLSSTFLGAPHHFLQASPVSQH